MPRVEDILPSSATTPKPKAKRKKVKRVPVSSGGGLAEAYQERKSGHRAAAKKTRAANNAIENALDYASTPGGVPRAHGGKSPKQSKKALRRVARLAARDPYPGPRASGITEAERIIMDFRGEGKTGKEIELERTAALAPTGIKIVRALTGDTPGATTPTLGEVGGIAATLGAAGVGAVARAPVLVKAVAATKKADEAASAAGAIQKARRAKLVKTGGRAKTAPKRAKMRTGARYSKSQRKVRRKAKLEKYAGRAANPVTPAVAQSDAVTEAVSGHVKALKEDPLKVLKTTERAALGMPGAALGDVVDLATGNFGDFAKSQKDYLSTVAGLFEGDSEKAKDLVLNDVGLIPAATGVLGGVAGVKAKRVVRPKAPKTPKPGRAQRRDLKALESPDPATRSEARKRLARGDYKEPARKAQKRRRRGSERSSVTAERDEGLWAVEARETGKRRVKVGPRRRVEADVAKLAKNRVGKSHITEAETLRLLGDLGLSGKELNLLGILKRERADLKDSERSIDSDSANTRAVLDALIAKPETVGQKRIQDVLDRLAVLQGERGIERGKEVGATGPTLSDEHVRYSGIMRNEGIKTRNERSPEVDERFTRARHLDLKAARLEKKGQHEEAGGLRAEAERQRAIGEEMSDARTREANEEARAKVKETGRREPIYFKQDDVTDPDSAPNSGVPQSRKAAKEKFRNGELARQGRVDESSLTLLTNLRAQRAAMAERGRQRSFVDEEFLVVGGERLRTREEWAEVAKRGEIPDGYDLVPIAEVAPATQRTPALRQEVTRKRLDVKATEGGTVLAAVPRSSLKEHRAQAERAAGFARGLRTVGRVQGIAMLATSPAWFALQPLASALVMAARNPNPAAWARASRSAIHTWRNASKRDRTTFNAMFGGNPADFLIVGDNVRGVSPYKVKDMRGALELAFKTPGGRFVRAVGRNIKEGGPLIKANRRMEANLRVLAAHLEMDRLAGLNGKGKPRITPRLLEFATKTSDATATIYSHMRMLEGKTPAERVQWYNDNPKFARPLERKINEAVGDWSSMTARERALSGIVVFYPFLRFSLRWLHYEFPKNNPVKAAIAANLSQQNAQELEALLGGPPGFFTGWGQVITHVGDEPVDLETGTGVQLFDLARVAPGGNALVETTAGADELNISTVTRPLQPLVGTALNALEGQDPFGNEKDASTLELLASGGVSLNPLLRPFKDDIIPPSDISELFRVIEGRDGSIDEGLVPRVIVDVQAEKEIAHLGRLLDTAYAYDSDEKQDYALGSPERKDMNRRQKASEAAWKEIDAMLVEYGVTTEAVEKQEDEQYSRRQYGASSSSSSSESGAFDSVFGGGATSSGGSGGGGAFQQVFGD